MISFKAEGVPTIFVSFGKMKQKKSKVLNDPYMKRETYISVLD